MAVNEITASELSIEQLLEKMKDKKIVSIFRPTDLEIEESATIVIKKIEYAIISTYEYIVLTIEHENMEKIWKLAMKNTMSSRSILAQIVKILQKNQNLPISVKLTRVNTKHFVVKEIKS